MTSLFPMHRGDGVSSLNRARTKVILEEKCWNGKELREKHNDCGFEFQCS